MGDEWRAHSQLCADAALIGQWSPVLTATAQNNNNHKFYPMSSYFRADDTRFKARFATQIIQI